MSDESYSPRVSRRKVLLWIGAGGALAAPGAYALFKCLFPRRESLVLTFDGPFSFEENLFRPPKKTPWIELYILGFADPLGMGTRLRLGFCIAGEDDPRRCIRYRVEATCKDGHRYTLLDGEQDDVREFWQMGRVVPGQKWGASAVFEKSVLLPVELSQITALRATFEHHVRKTASVGDRYTCIGRWWGNVGTRNENRVNENNENRNSKNRVK